MDMHGRIMNLPAIGEPQGGSMAYKLGHRHARHAAAEIASEGDALIAEMCAALERICGAYSANHSQESRASAWSDVRAAIAKARAFGDRS